MVAAAFYSFEFLPWSFPGCILSGLWAKSDGGQIVPVSLLLLARLWSRTVESSLVIAYAPMTNLTSVGCRDMLG